ncbi:MAG: HAD family hydrolase [Candidatus Omnitrophota bacterium]
MGDSSKKNQANIDKYSVFFFDFDGVIVDSLDIKSQAYAELFEGYGKDVVRKVMDYHLSEGWALSRYDKFKYYYKNVLHKKITPAIINELDKRFSELVEQKVTKAPFIKGVIEFLEALKTRGKECFIISATPEKEVKRIAESKRIDSFFKEIIGSPRTKKESMRYLLRRYKINPAAAVYFGDTKSDYEAALENAINFVGIDYDGNKELETLHGIFKVKDFSHYTMRRDK